jgi:hypothetical protein
LNGVDEAQIEEDDRKSHVEGGSEGRKVNTLGTSGIENIS